MEELVKLAALELVDQAVEEQLAVEELVELAVLLLLSFSALALEAVSKILLWSWIQRTKSRNQSRNQRTKRRTHCLPSQQEVAMEVLVAAVRVVLAAAALEVSQLVVAVALQNMKQCHPGTSDTYTWNSDVGGKMVVSI